MRRQVGCRSTEIFTSITLATRYWVAARTSAFGLGLRLPVTLLEQAVVIALFATLLTALPKAIVAWTEPDLPGEPRA